MNITLPSISYVVARSVPGNVIGFHNSLPWHLRSDLQRFKKITIGHPLIMGRKTHLSIGRPLPGRANIVLSRSPDGPLENTFWHKNDTAIVWAGDLPSALFFADVIAIAKQKSEIFVIGGAEMYRMFSPLFNKVHLTEVLTMRPLRGDAEFDFSFDGRRWSTLLDEQHPAGPNDEFPSRYRVLERKRKCVRYVEVDEFYTERSSKIEWLHKQLDLFRDVVSPRKRAPHIVPYQYKLFETRAVA